MGNQEVKLVITGEDKTQQAILSAGNGLKYLEGAITRLSIQFSSVSMAWNSAMQVIHKGMEYIELGGKAIKAEEAFHAMAEAAEKSAGRMLTAMKKAADGFVDESDLMQKAAFAMAQDIDPDKIPRLLEAARIAARKTGREVGEIVDGMAQAISVNMPRSLRQMGAITKEQMNLLNKAMAAGVTEVKLLDLVLANAAVTAAKLGPAANNMAREMDRAKVAMKELGELLGKELMWPVEKLAGLFYSLSSSLISLTAGYHTMRASMLEGMALKEEQGFWKPDPKKIAELRGMAQEQRALAKAAAEEAGNFARKGYELFYGPAPGPIDARSEEQKKRDIKRAEAKRKALEDATEAEIKRKAAAEKAEEALKSWGTASIGLLMDIEKTETDDFFDDLEKRLIDIDAKAEELRAKAEALPGKEKEEALALITYKQEAEAAAAIKEWRRKDLEDQAEASEKAVKQEDATREKIKQGAKETTEEVKKELERRRVMREGEIESRLAELDLLEKEGTAHRDTVAERIRLNEEMLRGRQADLDVMEKQKDPAGWNAQLDKIRQTRKALADPRHDLLGQDVGGALGLSLKETGNDLMELFGNVRNAVKKAFDGMTEALTDFVMTGKGKFSDLANSIIRDMIRIQIQQQITGPLSKAMGGLNWGGLFGGSSEPANAGSLTEPAGGWHSGGVAGSDRPTFYRIVPAAVFTSAPRYHSGIGPGERAAIIRDDEGVFTPGQMKKLAPAASAQQIKVEIINKNGPPLQASDAKINFNAQEMVVTIWLDALQYNKFGLRTALGG